MVFFDCVCLECGEQCDVEEDIQVLGPDKVPVGWVHEACADAMMDCASDTMVTDEGWR